VKHMSLIAVACWIALVPARAAEGVVTYKSLAPDVAFDLAQSALQQCRTNGYQVAHGSTNESKIIGDAKKRNVISAKTERAELKRRGILGPDFTEADEELRLAEEQQGLSPNS